MFEYFGNVFNRLKNFFRCRILKKNYTRSGFCSACGRCCEKIYVRHAKNVIQSEEEFEYLKTLHHFYTYLQAVDKDETGLIFVCQNLDEETRKCKIHKNRPMICRSYPQEEIFMMGGALGPECTFKFEPLRSFEAVFDEALKKSRKTKVLGNKDS